MTLALLDTIPYSPRFYVEEPHNEDIQQPNIHLFSPHSSSRVCTTVIKPSE